MTATLERRPSVARRVSTALYRRPRARLGILLSVPLLWLGLAYLGSLAALFIAAFWSVNDFTGQIVRSWTLDNFTTLFTGEVYRAITLRTIGVAIGVTVIDALIALPVAFYMAKVASPRAQRLLVVAILTPLWASYLVKVYAWRLMFSGDGILSWLGGTPVTASPPPP